MGSIIDGWTIFFNEYLLNPYYLLAAHATFVNNTKIPVESTF